MYFVFVHSNPSKNIVLCGSVEVMWCVMFLPAICWCANKTESEILVQGLRQGCNAKKGPTRAARLVINIYNVLPSSCSSYTLVHLCARENSRKSFKHFLLLLLGTPFHWHWGTLWSLFSLTVTSESLLHETNLFSFIGLQVKDFAVIMQWSAHLLHTGKPGRNFWHFFPLGIQMMVLFMNSLCNTWS